MLNCTLGIYYLAVKLYNFNTINFYLILQLVNDTTVILKGVDISARMKSAVLTQDCAQILQDESNMVRAHPDQEDKQCSRYPNKY